MSDTFNIHSIKRAARKEAWYGDSENPFRKTTRSSSWTQPSRVIPAVPFRDGDIEYGRSSLDITKPESVVSSAQIETSEQKDTHWWRNSLWRGKEKLSKFKEQTPVETTTDESWPLGAEGLSWDPFGSLSEALSDPLYSKQVSKTHLHHSQKIQQREVSFKGANLLLTTNQKTNTQSIDIHHMTIAAAGVQEMAPIYELPKLIDLSTPNPTQDSCARLFIVESVSPSMIEAYSKAFGCSIEVFHDHLRRAGDDVALILPSRSRKQSHVVIPYRRTYQLSNRKQIRESRNLRSSFSHGGLVTTEEHVTCWVSSTAPNGPWTGLIICDPDPIQSGNHSSNGESIRSRFESAIQSLSVEERTQLLADPFTLVRVLLLLVSQSWAEVLRDQEGYMLPGLKPQYTGATDVRLSEKESFGEYLKQTLGMLKMDLQIFQTLSAKSAAFLHAPDELLIDYEFLLGKAVTQIEQNTSSIPVITAMIAVEDNRKAIQQANDVKALTTLATIYIPLSFVAGIFGMNVTQLNPNPLVNIPLWLYFAVALPITALSMLLVWHWEHLLGCAVFIRRSLDRSGGFWGESGRNGMRGSALARALGGIGTVSVLVGPGKPGVDPRTFVEHGN